MTPLKLNSMTLVLRLPILYFIMGYKFKCKLGVLFSSNPKNISAQATLLKFLVKLVKMTDTSTMLRPFCFGRMHVVI